MIPFGSITIPTTPPPAAVRPDANELPRRAANLTPLLAARRNAAQGLRRVPRETIADLHYLGFFRAVQPARYGGYEMDPSIIYDLQLELARGCASSAWVFGVLSVHSWQLALFEQQAQDDVWGDDPQALISSSYMPVGQTERVEGGVCLSGHWSFSSGVDHCDWVMLGGFLDREDGKGKEMMTFLVPREDFEIIDNWHVTGLRASGSKDVLVREAFIPEHRLHRFSDGYRQESPGNRVNTSPAYRYPFGQIHVRCVSTPSLGALQGAIEGCVSALKGNGDVLDLADPRAAAIGSAAAVLDREVLALRRNFEEMRGLLDRGEEIPIQRRVRFRNDSASAVDAATGAIDDLYAAMGEEAMRVNHPVNKAFQDIHAIRQHHANGPDGPRHNFGRVLLGHSSTDFFI